MPSELLQLCADCRSSLAQEILVNLVDIWSISETVDCISGSKKCFCHPVYCNHVSDCQRPAI